MALRNLGVDFEYWKTSDWDVNAVASYKAIHHEDDNTDYSQHLNIEELVQALNELCVSTDGKKPMTEQQIRRKGEKWLRTTYNNFKASHNLGSITEIHAEDLEIDDEDYIHILTYSFPCTDLSLAGQRKGMDKDSGTSSSLLWEVERILRECKKQNCLPEVLLMENVTQVHGTKNLDNWNTWLGILEELGYKTYWKDLNAKHYGVAQNRDRCFAVSLLSDLPYEFPEPIELTKRLKDYLEETVDEKFYINNEKAQKLIVSLIDRGVLLPRGGVQTAVVAKAGSEFIKYTDVAGTLMARDYKGLGNYSGNAVLEI